MADVVGAGVAALAVVVEVVVVVPDADCDVDLVDVRVSVVAVDTAAVVRDDVDADDWIRDEDVVSVRPDDERPDIRDCKLDMLPMPPSSCISCCWFIPPIPPRIFDRSLSSVPVPERLDPGAGGLFKYSFILRHNSSSLSAFGSCIQKKYLRLLDLNFNRKTLPVVH